MAPASDDAGGLFPCFDSLYQKQRLRQMHSRVQNRTDTAGIGTGGREPQKKSMRLQKANERNESFTLGILSDDDYCNQGGMNNGNNAAVF